MIPVLEIGGTHVTAALVDLRDGRVTSRTRKPLEADGDAEAILGRVRDCADGLPVPPGARWGVAVPGPFDYARGIALFRGVGKFDALYGMNVRAALLHGLRQRPGDIVFLNDAHAFLTGEWSAGTVHGHRRVVGITLGTGVGSAFLADGRICDTGPGIPPEGRMDLTEIDGRPLEDTVSRRAILARYGDPAADVHDIAGRARAGEERAQRVLDDAFTGLGIALAPRMVGFGATALVVGGSMARSWDLVAPALSTGLVTGGWTPDDPRACADPLPPGARAIGPAGSAGDAALVGAARAAGGALHPEDGKRPIRKGPPQALACEDPSHRRDDRI
ncbi:ROK family protein [Streptomyces sp. NPDC051554]|uniref:ROK family protein n=1 Tax=Streptomyces sp. NPDC051554 TaxID=3365656 RepID=UPI00379F3908